MEVMAAYSCCEDRQRDIDPSVYVTLGLIGGLILIGIGGLVASEAPSVGAKLGGVVMVAAGFGLGRLGVAAGQ